MQYAYCIQIKTGRRECRRPGIIDDIACMIYIRKFLFQAADHIYNPYIMNLININSITIYQFLQVKRSTIICKILSCQVMNEGSIRIGSCCDLGVGLQVGYSREPDKM